MGVRGAGTFVAALALAALVAAPATAAPGPALTVDATADKHPISPRIYGLNFADRAVARRIDLPVDRWGGNTTDAYNWRLGAANTGQDWYYENVADCWNEAHGWCASGPVRGYREFVGKDRAVGAESLITLPMMGHVAKDAKLDHPFSCGFPATVFGAQDSFDPYDTKCGNGLQGGQPLASDPARDGTPVGADFSEDWVRDLVSRYGGAAAGGVRFYELGNEPALWSSTHRDMHPQPTTYDELWQKSRAYAEAVKRADPAAEVVGFSEWGWPNYFCSGADHVQNGCSASSPDRAAHGGTPLVEWLLRKMRAYGRAHDTRLLDYLDVHYYRQGGSTTDVTRSLWDPTYTDPSWIGDEIRLLPRMKEWVARNYRGTKLALTEYNLSVDGDAVTNGLIQADVLGIFAREGLDLATRWGMPFDGDRIDDAFRLYRDYDGHGAKFGDVWIRSRSADQSRLAVYGARRTADGDYTLIVINKTDRAAHQPPRPERDRRRTHAQTYRWTGAAIRRLADGAVPAAGFTATYPAHSATVYAIGD